MSDRAALLRLMLNLLIGSYALAGVLSPLAPIPALVFLSLACYLITLPYFMVQLFNALAMGSAMAVIVLLLTLLFPPLAIIGLLLNFAGILMRLVSFFKSLPYVFGGMFLYALLLVPCIPKVSEAIAAQSWPLRILICLAAGALTLALLLLFLRVLATLHLSRAAAAAVMLGFGSFLTLTFVLLVWALVSGHNGGGDGGDGGFAHDGGAHSSHDDWS